MLQPWKRYLLTVPRNPPKTIRHSPQGDPELPRRLHYPAESPMSRKLITFDRAIKRLLCSKANFGILAGFLSELLKDDGRIGEVLADSACQSCRSLHFYNRLFRSNSYLWYEYPFCLPWILMPSTRCCHDYPTPFLHTRLCPFRNHHAQGFSETTPQPVQSGRNPFFPDCLALWISREYKFPQE